MGAPAAANPRRREDVTKVFGPGETGNPNGWPKGATNRQPSALRLLRRGAVDVAKATLDRALAGDIDATRLVLDYGLAQPTRSRGG